MSFVVLQVLRHFCSVVNEANKTDTPFYYPTRIRLRIVATGPKSEYPLCSGDDFDCVLDGVENADCSVKG